MNMHYAVILAAGRGKRLGGRIKALLPFMSHTFIEEIIDNMESAGLFNRMVVLNPDGAERVKNAVNLKGTKIVINPEPDRGMLSSIQCALKEMPEDCEGMVLHLVDHPLAKTDTYKKVLEAAQSSPGKIIIPECGPRHGHPTVFPSKFFPEILNGPNDEGVRSLIRKHPEDVIYVSVTDSGIFSDVDTGEQFDRIQR
ncbi:MAG: nucleotidyltransferase family protein [Chloroflexi bacterium]|nr:nucleotidyltransferase family protein [Chloroflexota bacterium]